MGTSYFWGLTPSGIFEAAIKVTGAMEAITHIDLGTVTGR
jgi:hypothetical protein